MKEVMTALRRMAVYYLLLAVNIIPCASIIPDVFPVRNLSAVYLLALSVCLVLYYSRRVSPTGGLSGAMKALSWMGLLLILLRGIKYSVFAEVGALARHTWYLYYAPMLLIPLLLLYISLFVSQKRSAGVLFVWRSALALTVVFIMLVLTNDLHQLIFGFRPGFAGWDNDYTRGRLFYALNAWQYAMYFAAVTLLAVKCRISGSRKAAWIILIPFGIGIMMLVLLSTGKMPKLNGTYIVEFPEAFIFTAASVLECCMQLGLIPTNADHGKLFRNFSISAQITDKTGAPVYSSLYAAPLTDEQFTAGNGTRVNEHAVLNKMVLPGGYGFWQEDMTELDRLSDELAEAKDGLAQEAELIRLQNELKEKQIKIEQRTAVYDAVARRTQKQSQAISRLAEEARTSDDPALRDARRRRITLLGAYIKRYANLTLLSQEGKPIEAGELGLSVSEVLRYLNYCGVPGELINDADGEISSDAALAAFEIFERWLDEYYTVLRGVFVNLSSNGKTNFKLAFEGVSDLSADAVSDSLTQAGVAYGIKCEDDVAYVCLTLPKGGEAK